MIGETISAEEFNRRYPPAKSKVGQTLSPEEFNQRYPAFPKEQPVEQKKNFGQKLEYFLGNLGLGVAKGAVSTVKGAADLGQKIYGPLANKITNTPYQGLATDIIPKKAYTPSNVPQKIGFTGEQVAELFTPVGLETKGANLLTKSAVESAEFAGKTAIQTGGDKKQTITAAITGAALPIISKGLGSLLKGVAGTTSGVGKQVIKRAVSNPEEINIAIKKYGANDISKMGLVERAKNHIQEFLNNRNVKFGQNVSKLKFIGGAVEEPLIKEARKYKSAEEFVKAQGEPSYHGTTKDFTEFDLSKAGSRNRADQGFAGKGIYLTNSKEVANTFGTGKDIFKTEGKSGLGRIVETYLDPKSKVLEVNDFTELSDKLGLPRASERVTNVKLTDFINEQSPKIREKAMSMGYDAIKVDGGGVDKFGKQVYEMVVFDPSKIKTKVQLTDIYNQAFAKTTGKPFPKQEIVNHFAEELKQFKGKITNEGLKFNSSKLTEADRNSLSKFYNDLRTWTNFTPQGIEDLRQNVVGHMDQFKIAGNTRANVVLGNLKKFITGGLEERAPGYKNILGQYGKETQLAKDVLSELNLKGNSKPSTQLNSIMRLFKKDPQVIKNLSEIMGKEESEKFLNEISGALLSDWLPSGLAKQIVGGEIGFQTLLGILGHLNPATITGGVIGIAGASPKLVGKTAVGIGKLSQKGVGKLIRAGITKTVSR